MKTTVISILTFVSCMITRGQGFYPLHIGNVWEYWDCPQTFHTYTHQVIGDTTLPNNHTYAIIRQTPGGGRGFMMQLGPRVYLRPESDTTDVLMYDYSKTVGDTVAFHYYGDTTVVTVVYDRFANVFGRTLRQWGYWEQWLRSSLYILREVTDSIGLTFQTFEAAPNDDCLRGAIINGTQYGIITGVAAPRLSNPSEHVLIQNYPNPFNSTTVITFRSPLNEDVSIEVFDMLGRRVRILFGGKGLGTIQYILWNATDDNGSDLPSGVYLCRLQAKSVTGSRKMILLH